MSVEYCVQCDKMIDTDFDTHEEHFKYDKEEIQDNDN